MRGLYIAAFLLVTAPAAAGFSNGNDAWLSCNPQSVEYDRGYCQGLVSGLYGGLTATDSGLYCVPRGVTLGQMIDVFVTFLRNSPAVRHLPSETLMARALVVAFPCR